LFATYPFGRRIWAIYTHSNVRLPIGPLRMFIGAPELQHWHHSRERDAGNYANISPPVHGAGFAQPSNRRSGLSGTSLMSKSGFTWASRTNRNPTATGCQLATWWRNKAVRRAH